MFKKLAKAVLHTAEALCLFAYGWTYETKGFWSSPPDHPKRHKSISQGHAVNSMKHYAWLDEREFLTRKFRASKNKEDRC